MAHAPDYYAVLGVRPTADRVAIHSAWKALLRRYHPDVNHGADVSARAKEINEAYAVLGKKDARAAYDRSRPSPSSSSPHVTPRPVYTAPAGRRPMGHGPSARPGGSYSQPLDTNQWLVGIALLLLTAAPLAMIVVLGYEEAGTTSTVRRDAAGHRQRDAGADPDPRVSDTRPRGVQPDF
ncbi:hypothetical protein ASG29_14610 [Sphingomonas sp. Leaf412]|uniref:J domain-containing protein n=1 Tax=Sphingomonas sp. Leaf412 TaxID=1736370 RepID=UPI0006F56969|nr:J domain-containing protein [Sphingomonas sp. Leaf412]KQT31207.1 hypothetical protein ASG29_14610 [Sphingomonas sp. Leaf412]